MQFSAEQMQQMRGDRVRQRALSWSASIDAALPAGSGHEPQARLQVLKQRVIDDLGPDEALAAHDVRQAADWLQQVVAIGAPWRDIRAAALLHAAAALGSLWFIDARLLPASRQLSLQSTLAATLFPLLANGQGHRFKEAALSERRLRPGLRLAWRRAMAQELSEMALQDLFRAAFAAADPQGPEDDEPDLDDGASPLSPAATAFVQHEQRLIQQAGLAGGPLARLCLAGDLLLGLGRCARLAATLPPDSREPLLKRAIDAACRLQRQ